MIPIYRTTPPDPMIVIAADLGAEQVAAIHRRLQQDFEVARVQQQLTTKFQGELGACMIWGLIQLFGFAQDQALEILRSINRREELGTTGIGRETAIPNTRTDYVPAPVLGVLLFTDTAYEFDALDGEPIRTLCIALAPKQNRQVYMNQNFAKVLHDVGDARDVEAFRASFTSCYQLREPWTLEWGEEQGGLWR